MIRELFSTIVYEVPHDAAVALKVRSSQTLRVEAGRVWLTRSDDVIDYWLDAGACLRLEAGETLWLSAENRQAARVAFYRPARYEARLLAWAARHVRHAFARSHAAQQIKPNGDCGASTL